MRSFLIRTFMGALVFLCSGIYAYGQTFSLPSTNTTGTYSISYSHSGLGVTLIDELVDGNWRNIGGGGSSGVINIVKTQSGIYSYRSRTCMSSCSNPSAIKAITVTLASQNSPDSCVGESNTVVYCYDDLGRIKTVVYPNAVKNIYTYDSANNRTKKESTAN